MADTEFADGLYAKEPHTNAPDFVVCKINIKLEDFIKWAQKEIDNGNEWANIDIQRAKSSGNLYGKVDRWDPKPQLRQPDPRKGAANDVDDDIPF